MRGRYDNLKALVLGAGVSGRAAALLLRARGGSVTLVDERTVVATSVTELQAAGVIVAAGATRLPQGEFALCVASPGFALNHPWLGECRARSIPIISELELGAAYWRGRALAVTGSKGKSSLVKLCADALNAAGVTATPAGNYGVPLSQLVLAATQPTWAVVEVSSFQMELTERFAPEIAVLLNLQSDHLDRHASMAEYRRLKLKLFQAMKVGSLVLLPPGIDPNGAVPHGVRVERFGLEPECHWQYHDHTIRGESSGKPCCVAMRGAWFDNHILGRAAAAAVAALQNAGVACATIQAAIAVFEPLPHRMQSVAIDVRGVCFVNDSKATTLSAMAAALKMVQGGVRLIAGGVLKEHDLNIVKELLTQRAKKVYIIGHCCEELFQSWSDVVDCVVCGTLERAVSMAAEEAQSGEVVLLAPGAASFDQFKSYRERGERFTELARAVACQG